MMCHHRSASVPRRHSLLQELFRLSCNGASPAARHTTLPIPIPVSILCQYYVNTTEATRTAHKSRNSTQLVQLEHFKQLMLPNLMQFISLFSYVGAYRPHLVSLFVLKLWGADSSPSQPNHLAITLQKACPAHQHMPSQIFQSNILL